MDIDVERQHASRLALLDALLPADPPLSGSMIATVGALGLPTFQEVAPESLDATWAPLRRHGLSVRLAGADLGPLLDLWESHLARAAVPGDLDCAAHITWPSRDTAAVPALVHHGFAPLIVTAVRRAGVFGPTTTFVPSPARASTQAPTTAPSGHPNPGSSAPAGHSAAAPSAPPLPGFTIRVATKADLAACVALNLDVVRYDSQFGVITERPSTEAGLRQNTAEMLERDRPCVWLAEVAGRPAGIVTVDLPPHSDWIAGRTSAGPVAYLGLGGVRADLRGSGVGSALVNHVHRELDAAGIAVTLLHYALPNPRSAPFWSTQGYRPLWTSWYRRPALRD
ncbi:GNAT family N-acetyltransferase [Kutzneria sp. NPDC052558]|uniref:GNAT family N-acetyltransferase n=1 Tax=Kutzneria sp. NPDC052558 TaxID=3364121 RepID=UPI0037C5BEFB